MKPIISNQKTIFSIIMIISSFAILFGCKKDDKNNEEEVVNAPFNFKENLSDFKFYIGDLKNLEPAKDVFLYELANPLFSDYTIKDRFIKLPEGKSITYKENGVVDFPAGTIIIKNFSHPKTTGGVQRIETRLLVLDPYDNEWKVMVYVWNDAQNEAVKLIVGKNINIDIQDEKGQWISTNYKIPNTNDCKGCHISNSKILPIGPKARNLNFIPTFSTENQLESWSKDGIIKDLPNSGIPKLAVWNDSVNFDLNQRARSYLEINCAHCHSEGGAASYTGYWVDYDQTNTSKLGYFKVPIAAGPGSGTLSYDIVPGNADSSIVIYRMNSSAPGTAMPELARSVVHKEGVELIRKWINSL